VEIEK